MSDEVLSVKCPECGQLMTAPSSWAGREISCSACLATVRLPRPASEKSVPQDSAPPDDNTSRKGHIATPDTAPSPSNNEEPGDTYGLSDPTISDRSERGHMPFASKEDIETIPLRQSSEKTPSRRTDSDQEPLSTYGLGPVHDAPVMKIEVFAALARVRRDPDQKPPANVFFSNVFEFPWSSSDVFFRWLWTSLALMTGTVLLAVCIMTIHEGGTLGWMLAGFFIMASLACVIWAMSYAASCANSILQDTAAGNDRVESWSEDGVIAWIFDFLPLFYVYLVSGAVALVVAMPLQFLIGSLTPQLFLTQLVTFPITWLCALDAQTIWVPFSIAVLRTIPLKPQLWAKFIGLSSALILTAFSLMAGILHYIPWPGCLLAGPLLSSILFIYPRLLGRLIWKISDILNREAKNRSSTPQSRTSKPRPKQTASHRK